MPFSNLWVSRITTAGGLVSWWTEPHGRLAVGIYAGEFAAQSLLIRSRNPTALELAFQPQDQLRRLGLEVPPRMLLARADR